jgi:NAD(P)-dependent dehydrogenase (short-subunit alcohol dehydrogenase family)
LDDALIEVGIDAVGRWKVAPEFTNGRLPGESPLPVSRDSVVLITGGAMGVTAAVAKALAREAAPRLILVGRSPLPAVEPETTRSLREVSALRQHLIAEMRTSNPQVRPAEIEGAVRAIVKAREFHANLEEMKQYGSPVEYQSVDVRDQQRFTALIDDIYTRHGQIDGVIHGAGVIDDKRVANKTWESFERVFTTKVHGALALANSLRPSSLKFLVFFSSVSARLGNAGQIDYCAANEYLNKLAAHLNQRWPARVMAVNWGPWEGGMVSDELRSFYKSEGVELIKLESGARWLLDELRHPGPATPELIVAAGTQEALRATAGA